MLLSSTLGPAFKVGEPCPFPSSRVCVVRGMDAKSWASRWYNCS